MDFQSKQLFESGKHPGATNVHNTRLRKYVLKTSSKYGMTGKLYGLTNVTRPHKYLHTQKKHKKTWNGQEMCPEFKWDKDLNDCKYGENLSVWNKMYQDMLSKNMGLFGNYSQRSDPVGPSENGKKNTKMHFSQNPLMARFANFFCGPIFYTKI